MACPSEIFRCMLFYIQCFQLASREHHATLSPSVFISMQTQYDQVKLAMGKNHFVTICNKKEKKCLHGGCECNAVELYQNVVMQHYLLIVCICNGNVYEKLSNVSK